MWEINKYSEIDIFIDTKFLIFADNFIGIEGVFMRCRQNFSLYKRRVPVKGKIKIIYYYHCYDENGKRLGFSTGKTKKSEARAYCEALYKEDKLIPDIHNQTLFKNYSKDWFIYDKCTYVNNRLKRGEKYTLAWCQINRSRLERYLLPYFGNKVLVKITRVDVEDWFLSLKRLSVTSKNQLLRLLRVMLKEAQRRGIISHNPAEDVRPLPGKCKTRGVLTQKEVKKLFAKENFGEYWKGNAMYYTANMLAFCTGMRQGEIAALTGEDIFPGYIVVKHSWSKIDGLKTTKAKKERLVPISDFLYQDLKSLCRPQKSAFIFSKTGGRRPVTGQRLKDALYFALAKMGIDKNERRKRNIVFHSSRHFANTQFIGAGISTIKTQAVIGHAGDSMTENYLHLHLEQFQDILSVQQKILK